MVSADEFYRQTNKNFETIGNKIDDIKEDLTKLQAAYNSHIAVGKALEKSKKISFKQKLGIILGVTPIIIAIFALFS